MAVLPDDEAAAELVAAEYEAPREGAALVAAPARDRGDAAKRPEERLPRGRDGAAALADPVAAPVAVDARRVVRAPRATNENLGAAP